ncbi:TPA: hypothetical protein DD449_01500 [Candidatus Berkelbacteria bacterium]|uniref:Dephospho-CoA kinase n=1 Tax=Berkelbacteria bacterium GW2011_GWE1_39_12 TaxID=1618337 RepID=A0A0G4B3N7_9BACT|nr:MAG: hypothetical protein UT28_C0001G0786 [Berkelbacteria bacterium GW2011_GWE1_39_12]HBO60345.1 hypothetical protein [Candidatus Berkelbacteria bacterium]
MILGISGTFGGGKDTIAEYLIEKDFQHISCSDILREEARRRGLTVERENLRILGNEFLKKIGPGALAKKAVKEKTKKNLALSSVRQPGEVDYLHTIEDFKLIFVDAPIELRFERMKKRSENDPEKIEEQQMSLEDLKHREDLEMSGKSSQVLSYCKENADYLIDNSKTKEDLYKTIDKIITENK